MKKGLRFMTENIRNVKIINIEEFSKRIENQINVIIRDATYPELSKYIEMLPKDYESDDSLFSWGFSYLNEYYKIIGKLDKIDGVEIEELKHKIYILYLKENYNTVVFTFDEFITFSRLLNITFSEYNPDKTRKKDKKPYQSGDIEIDNIVNEIAKNVIHSPHPHAYEITKFKLKILLNALINKRISLLGTEFNSIDLDNNLLNNVLSKKRIKRLKEISPMKF